MVHKVRETQIMNGSKQITIGSQDDTVAQVLWSDEHGRVRGLGRVVTAKLLGGSPTVLIYTTHLYRCRKQEA